MNVKKEEEQAKLAASRRKRPHAHQIEATSSKAPTVEPETPRKRTPDLPDEKPVSHRGGPETPRLPKLEKVDQAASPMSTTSSTSEPPLAHKGKANGVGHSTPSAPAMAPSQSESSEGIQDTPQDSPAVLPSVSSSGPGSAPKVGRPARVSRPLSRTEHVTHPRAGDPAVAEHRDEGAQ